MSGEVDKMIATTNAELEKSKRLLQDLSNELVQMMEIVKPALTNQIEFLRSARMTTLSEIQQCMTAFRDCRRFFLEPEHEIEMKRLREFVELAKELKKLKDDGTLDAIADISLRMAAR